MYRGKGTRRRNDRRDAAASAVDRMTLLATQSITQSRDRVSRKYELSGFLLLLQGGTVASGGSAAFDNRKRKSAKRAADIGGERTQRVRREKKQ